MSALTPKLQMLFPGLRPKAQAVPAAAAPTATASAVRSSAAQSPASAQSTGGSAQRRRPRGMVTSAQRLSGTKQLLGE